MCDELINKRFSKNGRHGQLINKRFLKKRPLGQISPLPPLPAILVVC